jgi:hypothetical protein
MSEFKQIIADGWKKALLRIRKFTVALLLFLVAGSGIYMWVCNWTYSTGSRAGYLIKASKKGVVFKTYEGELNLGGVQTDPQTGTFGNIWEFSIVDKNFYQKLQGYEGKHIKINYREVYKAMPWQGKTNYLVYDVQPVQ